MAAQAPRQAQGQQRQAHAAELLIYIVTAAALIPPSVVPALHITAKKIENKTALPGLLRVALGWSWFTAGVAGVLLAIAIYLTLRGNRNVDAWQLSFYIGEVLVGVFITIEMSLYVASATTPIVIV